MGDAAGPGPQAAEAAKPESIPRPAPMRAGWCSKLWFAYLNPMLAKGATEPLQFPDVFPLPVEQESTGIHGVFDAAWRQQLSQHGEAGASIWAAIYAAAGWRFWSSGALLL